MRDKFHEEFYANCFASRFFNQNDQFSRAVLEIGVQNGPGFLTRPNWPKVELPRFMAK